MTYLTQLEDLIAAAIHERDQVKRHGDTLKRNPFVQLKFVEAGAAMCDDWSEWAKDLAHSLEGVG